MKRIPGLLLSTLVACAAQNASAMPEPTPAGAQAQVQAASPALLADRVTAPVLLIHGTEDEVVVARQSELMQRALERAGKPVRFVELEGAGHTWYAWTVEQRTILFTETESFLAQHIGPGR